MPYTYTEQLQRIANQYLREHGGEATTKRDIAAWAVSSGLWQPQRSDLISQCAEQLARAMREEYITDPQGRSVRAKHVARIEQRGRTVVPVGRYTDGAGTTHANCFHATPATDRGRMSPT